MTSCQKQATRTIKLKMAIALKSVLAEHIELEWLAFGWHMHGLLGQGRYTNIETNVVTVSKTL